MKKNELVPQTDYCFLHFSFDEWSIEGELEGVKNGDEDYKGYMHDTICATISDIYGGETVAHTHCEEAYNDGIYVEVIEDEPYCTRDSKVYIVQEGEAVYEALLSEYGSDFESYFE